MFGGIGDDEDILELVDTVEKLLNDVIFGYFRSLGISEKTIIEACGDTRLVDIGLDEIDYFELLMEIEDVFGVTLDDPPPPEEATMLILVQYALLNIRNKGRD